MHELSKFLPDDFDKTATIALIAGKGAYPKIVRDKLDALGIGNSLIAFEDETSPELFNSYPENNRAICNVGQLGKLLKNIKRTGAKYAIMVGQITPKKLFKGVVPDLKALTLMATLKKRNAETIFGALANEMDKIGVFMLDARSFLDEYIAPKGLLYPAKWKANMDDAMFGMKIARECARLDIGQACVVSNGSVIAVEAFEGTDKMIERAGTFEAKECIFAKTVKPRQDYRFDVPVIGERTIRKLASSNIKYAVLEADSVIVLQMDEVLRLARENDIKIMGV